MRRARMGPPMATPPPAESARRASAELLLLPEPAYAEPRLPRSTGPHAAPTSAGVFGVAPWAWRPALCCQPLISSTRRMNVAFSRSSSATKSNASKLCLSTRIINSAFARNLLDANCTLCQLWAAMAATKAGWSNNTGVACRAVVQSHLVASSMKSKSPCNSSETNSTVRGSTFTNCSMNVRSERKNSAMSDAARQFRLVKSSINGRLRLNSFGASSKTSQLCETASMRKSTSLKSSFGAYRSARHCWALHS
mmetsp:Transcript_100307/g.282979  ORF Transcript_100307/g.282979 Transcript_100307/m.282979 type:complete len:252 (+) Transcript_100307:1073-1828(+)